MTVFTANLTKGQAVDLASIINEIAPKDIPTLKEMNILVKTKDKFLSATTDFQDYITGLNDRLEQMRKENKPEEIQAFREEGVAKVNELRTEVIQVELSDEQLESIKKWFNSQIRPRLTNMKACLDLAEVFGIE